MLGPVCWPRCLLIYCDLRDLRSGGVTVKGQERSCVKQHEDRQAGPGCSQMFRALHPSCSHTDHISITIANSEGRRCCTKANMWRNKRHGFSSLWYVTEDFSGAAKSACGLSKVVTILLIVVKYDRFEKSWSAAMMTVVHDSKRHVPWYCGANHFPLMLLHPFQQQWSVESYLQISSTFPTTVLREN